MDALAHDSSHLVAQPLPASLKFLGNRLQELFFRI